MPIPRADFDVTETLVRELLKEQHPDLASLPIQFYKNGWDNFLFRLGHELIVRLPRREASAESIRKEQRYLPTLAPQLPLLVPSPIRVGEPGCDFPWYWSICPCLSGATADAAAPADNAVKQWAQFLKALHVAGPKGGPHNPYRGVPLITRADAFMESLHRVAQRQLVNFSAIDRLWQQGLDADPGFIPCWGHGDLHPMNILCSKGKFIGVIDWGDMYVGDPATDLASFFMLFAREIAELSLRDDYHADAAQISRAKASAVFFAVVLLDSGVDVNQQQVAIAHKTFLNLGLANSTI